VSVDAPVVNPTTGVPFARVHQADKAEVDLAVERAGRARAGWAGTARGVESGNLSVNSHFSVRFWTPFGGFKQSGLGRERGPDALDSFTDTKNVFISSE
jgi:acyl-CoA reductase-like NAD-dependent aldehyde dehydrogenase